MIRTYLCLVWDGKIVARIDVTQWPDDLVRQIDGIQFYDVLPGNDLPFCTQFKIITQVEPGV